MIPLHSLPCIRARWRAPSWRKSSHRKRRKCKRCHNIGAPLSVQRNKTKLAYSIGSNKLYTCNNKKYMPQKNNSIAYRPKLNIQATHMPVHNCAAICMYFLCKRMCIFKCLRKKWRKCAKIPITPLARI